MSGRQSALGVGHSVLSGRRSGVRREESVLGGGKSILGGRKSILGGWQSVSGGGDDGGVGPGVAAAECRAGLQVERRVQRAGPPHAGQAPCDTSTSSSRRVRSSNSTYNSNNSVSASSFMRPIVS